MDTVNRTIEFSAMHRRGMKWFYHDLELELHTNMRHEMYAKVNGRRFYVVSGGKRMKDYTYKNKKD